MTSLKSRGKAFWEIYNSVRRHPKKVAMIEGGIAFASVVLGEVAGKAADAILWDPDPGVMGRHIINQGLPFVIKQIIIVVNAEYPYSHKTLLDLPENFGKNAGFYGVLSFVLFNAVILGVYGLFNRNRNRKIKA
ncbi:hypothetical protein MUP01_04855 [Candidatus Bathyarchaeota archaeon]|nr:hypothetical protein [Candidatus Bathyarchaeota archaeon]